MVDPFICRELTLIVFLGQLAWTIEMARRKPDRSAFAAADALGAVAFNPIKTSIKWY